MVARCLPFLATVRVRRGLPFLPVGVWRSLERFPGLLAALCEDLFCILQGLLGLENPYRQSSVFVVSDYGNPYGV